MKLISMDAILHALDELMDEFKVGKYAKWELDFEIGVWHEQELELARSAAKEEDL